MKHTPTPWHLSESRLRAPNNLTIADLRFAANRENANAEFIVRAVNAHDALLEACKWAVRALEGGSSIEVHWLKTVAYENHAKALAAIKLAEEGK